MPSELWFLLVETKGLEPSTLGLQNAPGGRTSQDEIARELRFLHLSQDVVGRCRPSSLQRNFRPLIWVEDGRRDELLRSSCRRRQLHT